MTKKRRKSASKDSTPTFLKVAECLYRHQSSGTYYGLVKRAGKQFRRSLKTTDRKLAERRLAEFRSRVGRLTKFTGRSNITFEELAQQWLSVIRTHLKSSSYNRRKTALNQLNPIFGSVAIRNITARHCDEWVTRRGKKLAAQSFNIERETLILVLNHAKRDGIILDNPAEAIKRRKLSKATLLIPTKEQFRILVEMIGNADRRARHGSDLVELLAYSGMRLSEATSLKWHDIDLERGVFTVTGGDTGTKNREARTIPLFPAMRRLLKRIQEPEETRPADRVIPIDSAKKAIITACQKAKLPQFNHHCLRHYFVSNAIEAGVDFKVIAGWVGHKDGGVLVAKTYGHLRDQHSFEMAKRMNFTATDAEEEEIIALQKAG